MSILENFKSELEQESIVTRKMLAIIPKDKYDWQPHVKSMTIRQLAGHIAELPSWIAMAFTTEELDFAKIEYTPPVWNSIEELLNILEQSINQANAELEKAKEDDLLPEWTLRHGEQILSTLTKGGLVRLALSQTIHHRAQLGVYLRLLDVPIPGSYGPSADDPTF
jgi:uncharacterized damage-inducible protein DinB